MSLHDQIDYWAEHAQRPLTKLEQLMLARPFKLSKYWHNWSRVIKPVWAGIPLGLVEVDITPVNGFDSKSQVEVLKEMRIRNHLTAVDPRDKFSSSLPEDIRQQLLTVFSNPDEVQYLMYGNIWENIDWDKYRTVASTNRGGGVPLAQCQVNSTYSATLLKD